MITLIVLITSAISHIKHIIIVVGIRKAVTEPVASAEADLCSSNLSGRTSAELSQSTVPAHNCGDGVAPSKLVAHHNPESPAISTKDSTSQREEMRRRYFTKVICTFASGFNNLWIIPTLQAILKLTVIQDKLPQQTPSDKTFKYSKICKFVFESPQKPGKTIQ